MEASHKEVIELLSQHHPLLDQQVIIDTFIKGFITQPWDPNNQVCDPFPHFFFVINFPILLHLNVL